MSLVTPLLPCPSCHAKNRLDLARLGRVSKCGRCGEALPPPAAPLSLDDATFDDAVATSELPVLVDFWAGWCGPCRNFAPTLHDFAEANGGKVLVVKVDVDAAPKTAARLRIQSIPTIALFRGGREVARQVGALTAPQLARFAATQ